MNYKSAEETILYPEYGRHVQNLVKYALTIEDDAKRQSIVEGIIVLMGQILPNHRNVEEQQDRFWNHICHIADYKLNVTYPDTVEIIRVEDHPKPDSLSYPTGSARYRHYGLNVQNLVEKALAMEDKEKQIEFVKIIGNYMKTAYRTWNAEHFVSDEMIINDLAKLSDGQFIIDEDMHFVSIVPQSSGMKKPPRKSNSRSGYSKSRNSNRNNTRKSNRPSNRNNNNNNNRNKNKRKRH